MLIKRIGPLLLFLKWLKKNCIVIGNRIEYLIWLLKEHIIQMLAGRNNINADSDDRTESRMKITFVVTEAGEHVTAGDYFTANELGQALEKFGWKVSYIETTSKERYHIDKDTDIVVSMLESYDIRRIGLNNKHIIKVAWARNWFESWAEQPYIKHYDYILASSEVGVSYMEEVLKRKVHLLKIGTNTHRFDKKKEFNQEYLCDYCFTGSYWKEPREIMNMLYPEELQPYVFHLYGANWNYVEKFCKYDKGFVDYKDMPKIYNNTKILIDDANRVTKPFGSVNSRVFDALASGTLVITNGLLGAKDTFEDKLPTYSTSEELQETLRYYLEHEKEREELVTELQMFVREYHSYDYRAEQLMAILSIESDEIDMGEKYARKN